MRATWNLGRFLRPYWAWAVAAPLLMALEVAMDLLQPWLVERIIDQGVARGDMRLVLATGGWMLAAALVGLAGGMGCAVYAILAGQHFGADLRAALFRKVQSLSFANLDQLETGALITRLTNDVTQLQELVMMLLRVMVRVPLLFVGSLIIAIITSPQLALLFLGLIPVVLVALIVIINKTFPLFGEVQRRLDTLNTVMQENLAGARVVKAFARAQYELARFGRANNSLMEQNTAAMRASAVTMPFMLLALNAGVVAALWVGGLKIANGTLQAGQLVAFINYLMQALMSLMMVSMLIIRVARAAASAERVEQVLTSRPVIQPQPGALADFAPRGRLAFEHVSFGYDDEGPRTSDEKGVDPALVVRPSSLVLSDEGRTTNDKSDPTPSSALRPSSLVLDDISFTAEPGQTVALLGATGTGKSTLVNLIPRFYDATGGRVTIDGVDVRALDPAALRRAVGIALQESVLFSGTIRDNIRYGRPDAGDDEVQAAATMAQAHEFIMRFPDGYDSVVGQRGVNLSGGQRQRIAIARTLLVRPAVLILDDSTSAVDVETESRIQAALAEGRASQTRLVVAQRISTVLGADMILVLDDGRIAAQGTHAELLADSPIYREIYDSQLEEGAVSHGPT